jgi:hypothetical protein
VSKNKDLINIDTAMQELSCFTLDLSKVMKNQQVRENFSSINSILKTFLINTYSPILARLEKIYKTNSSLEGSDPELQEIATEIKLQLKELGWSDKNIKKYSDITEDISSSNSDTPTNFAFILQCIVNNKSVDEIINGYDYDKPRLGLADRIKSQFNTDFSRMKFCVKDQNEDIITENLNADILTKLSKAEKEPNCDNLCEELKSALNLSDAQLKLIVSRYNQRSIQSASVAFIPGAQKTREDIFYVEKLPDGSLKLKSLEHKAVMQDFNFALDGDIIGKFDLNQTRYIIDVSNLDAMDAPNKSFLALPTQEVSEKLIYTPLHERGVYDLEDCFVNLAIKSTISIAVDKDAFPMPPLTIIDSLSDESSVIDDVAITRVREVAQAATKFVSKIRSTIVDNIVGKNPKVVKKALGPSELNSKIKKILIEANFIDLNDPLLIKQNDSALTEGALLKRGISSNNSSSNLSESSGSVGFYSALDGDDDYQDLPLEDQKSALLCKERGDSIIFISEACNDIDRSNNLNDFILSGGRNITDALEEVMTSQECKEAKSQSKKIEIILPLAITRSPNMIKRNHWITSVITINNDEMKLEIIDSLPFSFGYSYGHLIEEINVKLIDIANQDIPFNEPTDEHALIHNHPIKLNSEVQYQYTGAQGILDNKSCGFHVIDVISNHALKEQDSFVNRLNRSREGSPTQERVLF